MAKELNSSDRLKRAIADLSSVMVDESVPPTAREAIAYSLTRLHRVARSLEKHGPRV